MTDFTTADVPARDGASIKKFYIAAWRWHFYAGLYVAPFLIMLALTGLVMLWTSALFGRDGEYLYPVQPAGQAISVSEQAKAAAFAIPGGTLTQYIAPSTPTGSALFRVDFGDQSTMVAVNPYEGKVLGLWARRDALYDIADTIHGSLLIGTLGDRLIEIAAGFGVVLVVTGLYLWWPREGRGIGAMAIPQFSAKGRQLWKSLHQSIGFWCAAILIVFLVSGLTWTGIWGEKFTQAWSTFPAEKWDNVPLSDKTHGDMLNHDGIKNVPWALEQTKMPVSGSKAGLTGVPDGQPVDLDAIAALASGLGFDNRYELAFPATDTGVWTISRDTSSKDSVDPRFDRTVHVDQYSGKILADVGFADYSLAGKAMAVGVPLHEGDMGLWNLIFNTLFCLSIIFMSVSGIVMWWKRRPSGATRLVAPALPEKLGLWKGGAIVMLAVAVLFPLSGLVLAVVLALDMLVISRIAPLKRAIS